MNMIDAAKTTDIASGQMKNLQIAGKDVLLANIGGQFYAIGGKCTHAGGDLSKGILTGKMVTCPRHGSQFDATTGKVVGGPASKNEPWYEVKIEGNIIKIIV